MKKGSKYCPSIILKKKLEKYNLTIKKISRRIPGFGKKQETIMGIWTKEKHPNHIINIRMIDEDGICGFVKKYIIWLFEKIRKYYPDFNLQSSDIEYLMYPDAFYDAVNNFNNKD